MKRSYTEEGKATALAILKANGGNLGRAAKASDVPRNTLRRWMVDPRKAAPEALRRQKEDELADRWSEVRDLSIGRAKEALERGEKLQLRDLFIGAGIATDKVNLLTGKPTERTEVMNLADFLKGAGPVPAPIMDKPRPTPLTN